jgi:outer membrane protein insertion porin family
LRRNPTTPLSAVLVTLLYLLVSAFAAPEAARAQADRPIKVLVAVLPFEVHSSEPLDYLESSLADLLATRLEASGEVEVIEAVTVREALIGYPGERTEERVREMARDLGADWVIVGSLTELAGQYSLDVRVTPVESRIATSTMTYAAEDDDELLDRVGELAARVVQVVSAGVVVERVSLVLIEGAPDEEAARAVVLLEVGDPFDEVSVRRDVAELEALPGVARVVSETSRDESGVTVVYRFVSSGAVDPGVDVPGGDRIADVEIRGNRRIESAAILARVSSRAGELFHPARLAEDVRAIYELGFFSNVLVYAEEDPEGYRLVFEVEENPIVRQVTISGNDKIDGEKIKDNLTLTTGSTLDLPLLFENQRRIEAIYRAEGYYLARVRHEVEPLQGEAVAIHFDVVEGKKLKLREIDFAGNEHFTDKELREGLKTKTWKWYSIATQYLDKSGTYSEPVFLQDLRKVSDRYLDEGYIQAEIGEPDVVPGDDGLVVVVDVTEGDRFKVSSVDVMGDETLDIEVLKAELLLKEGEWFNRSFLNADLEGLERRYTDRGFYAAEVAPRTRVDQGDQSVDIVFDVEKGSLHFLREIDITGNTTTVDPVIRREMQMVEGELYSARAVEVSRIRAEGLGFFEEVDIEPRTTDEENQVDLGVKVVERPTGSLSFGAGFSSRDGIILSGSVSQSNLFGRGYGGSISADFGGESDRFFVNFIDPYFLGSTWAMNAQLFYTDLEFDSFEQKSLGGELVASHLLDEEGRTRLFLRYAYAQREVTPDNDVNAASILQREILSGNESTSLLGLSVRQDLRNDRIAPTAGRILEGSVDYAGLGGFSNFLRFEGRGVWYKRNPEWFPGWFPFKERGVWSFGARAGWAIPFNTIGDYDFDGMQIPGLVPTSDGERNILAAIDTDVELPLTERYFMGGIGAFQMRGYEARSLGPRRAVLYSPDLGVLLGRTPNSFTPVGRQLAQLPNGDYVMACGDFTSSGVNTQGNLNQECNSIFDTDVDDFDDLEETDVIGGNKFFSGSLEYRFPISEELGLLGILFIDFGNSFAEDQNMWDIDLWRMGTGFGGLWFSPFGPLQAFVGFPLDPLDDEDSPVFEFSVGGQVF